MDVEGNTSRDVSCSRLLETNQDLIEVISNCQKANADAVELAAAAAREALAAVLRSRNWAFGGGGRLPLEVWQLIWDELGLDDRITVTHVCHFWRSAALQRPRFWCRVDFWYKQHYGGCQCSDCEYREAEHRYLARRRAQPPPALTNIHCIPTVLERSQGGPLDILIQLYDFDADGPEALETIGAVLAPHAACIVSLEIRTSCELGIPEFFAEFPVLPALRALKVIFTGIFVYEDRHHGVGILGQPIDLPVLERLEFDDEVFFKDPRFVVLNALTYLKVSFSDADELRDILDACPSESLRELEVFPRLTRPITPDDATDLSDLLWDIGSVGLLDVKSSHVDSVLAAFKRTDRPSLFLQCPAEDDLPPPHAKAILSEVTAPIKLALEEKRSTGRVIICVSGACGRRRGCEMSQAAAWSTLWDLVPPFAVSEIYMRVEFIMIMTLLPARLPHLRALQLFSAPEPTAVPAPAVAGLILSRNIGRPLQQLLLSNVALTDDLTVLGPYIVDSVHNRCPIPDFASGA